MPITIEHNPNPALYGQTGQAVGLGQFAQQQFQNSLQAQALNNQTMMDQARIQAMQPKQAPIQSPEEPAPTEQVAAVSPQYDSSQYEPESAAKIEEFNNRRNQIKTSQNLDSNSIVNGIQQINDEESNYQLHHPYRRKATPAEEFAASSTVLPDGRIATKDSRGGWQIHDHAPPPEGPPVLGSGVMAEGPPPPGGMGPGQPIDSHPNADGSTTLIGADGKYYDAGTKQQISKQEAQDKATWTKLQDGTVLDAKHKVIVNPISEAHKQAQDAARTAAEQLRTEEQREKTIQRQHEQYDKAFKHLTAVNDGKTPAPAEVKKYLDDRDAVLNPQQAAPPIHPSVAAAMDAASKQGITDPAELERIGRAAAAGVQ